MVFTPPYNIAERDRKLPSIFLAGSIEMGKAEDWQGMIIEKMDQTLCNIFNPRRSDWDSKWRQSQLNPYFTQQVNWELNALEQANVIIFYFQPGTISPISLLELGKFAKPNSIIVCPEGFHRKGNVDIFCEKYNIRLSKNLDEGIGLLNRFINFKY